MELCPLEVLGEILKHVHTRNIFHIALTCKSFNFVCLKHIENKDISSKLIRISFTKYGIEVFMDDDIEDFWYAILSKRIFTKVIFTKIIERHNFEKETERKMTYESFEQKKWVNFPVPIFYYSDFIITNNKDMVHLDSNGEQMLYCYACGLNGENYEISSKCVGCGVTFCGYCDEREGDYIIKCADCDLQFCNDCDDDKHLILCTICDKRFCFSCQSGKECMRCSNQYCANCDKEYRIKRCKRCNKSKFRHIVQRVEPM